MQIKWLLKATKIGVCMGLTLTIFTGAKINCLHTNSKLSALSFSQIFKRRLSKFKAKLITDFMKPYGFTSPHIILNANNHNLYNAYLDLNVKKDFDHLKFFNAIQELWHQLKVSATRHIESSKRIIKDHLVIYQFQYFTLDKKNNRIKTVIKLIGDTRSNIYKFVIESNSKFGTGERELTLNALDLAKKLGAEYNEDYKVVSRIAQAGWTVIEFFSNNCLIENSFGKEILRTNIESIMRLQSTNEA